MRTVRQADSEIVGLVPVPASQSYLPLPSGTPFAGQVPVAAGSGEASQWGPGGGVTVLAPPPSGNATTDLVNIAAAIAALPVGGGTVQLQAGTYQVPAPSTASNGCVVMTVNNSVLAGMGMGATIIQLAPGSNPVTGIVRTPSGVVNSRITFRDFTIDGNYTAQSGSPLVHGFYCGVTPGNRATDTDITCQNLEVMNCTGYGFDPHERTTRFKAIGCVSHDNGQDGKHDGFTLDANYESELIGCIAFGNGRHGFNLVTASNAVRLVGCDSYQNSGCGIVLQNGTKDCVMAGCSVHDNVLEGILINGIGVPSQLDPTPGFNNAVKACTIERSGSHGIQLIGASGQTITGNTIRDSGQAANNVYSQILLDESGANYSTGNTITANDLGTTTGVTNAPAYGIREASSNENANLVIANQISGSMTANLNLLGATTIRLAAHNGTAGAHPQVFAHAFDEPAFHGYKEWNFPPALAGSSAQVSTGGTVYLLAVQCSATETISEVSTYLGAAGSSLTAGENLLGLYTLGGGVATLQGTVDMSTAWSTSTNVGAASAGTLSKSTAVTAGEVVLVGLLVNGSGSLPSFSRGPGSTGSAGNAGLSKSSPYLYSVLSARGQTTLPSSITLSTDITASGALTFWVALS